MVWSAVGSTTARVVSLPSAVAPSKITALAPATVPFTVITSSAALPRVTFPFSVALPDTVRFPATVAFAPENVTAVVPDELDLRTSSPLLFVNVPKSVPPSWRNISAPSASRIMSAPESRVIPDTDARVVTPEPELPMDWS